MYASPNSLLIMNDVMDEKDGMFIRSAAALCELECDQLNTPFLNQPDVVTHRHIIFETFSNKAINGGNRIQQK